jgi:hypothetical protein
MRKDQVGITKRFVAAVLVIAVVVGVSAIATNAPTQNQNSVALKSIKTDKATRFYAGIRPNNIWFVEQVLPGTSESKAATENLKAIAAAL